MNERFRRGAVVVAPRGVADAPGIQPGSMGNVVAKPGTDGRLPVVFDGWDTRVLCRPDELERPKLHPSIFHVLAATPEDMRTEVVEHLQRIVARERSAVLAARTQKAGLIASGRMQIVQELIDFWRFIIIDAPVEQDRAA